MIELAHTSSPRWQQSKHIQHNRHCSQHSYNE